MEETESDIGETLDAPNLSLYDAFITVAEERGDFAYEWKGRHLVRKSSGRGGLAGFYRSVAIVHPEAFRGFVRKMFRDALNGPNVGAIYQMLTNVDVSQLTVHKFIAMLIKGEYRSHSSAPLPRGEAKRRLKALLDDLDPDPQR